MMNLPITIVIVNYFSSILLTKLVIMLCRICKNSFSSIIIVNNSQDDEEINSLDNLNLLDKRIKVINCKQNLGFGQAVNLGVNQSRSKFLLLLNPDIQFDIDFISLLYRRAVKLINETQRDIIMAPLILNPSTSQTSPSGGKFPTIVSLFAQVLLLNRIFPEYYNKNYSIGRTFTHKFDDIIQIDYVSGAAFFVSRNIFEKLDGFKKDYFLYFEETDLCFRAKMMGVNTYLAGDISIIHQSGTSTPTPRLHLLNLYYNSYKIFLYLNNEKKFASLYFLLLRTIRLRSIAMLKFSSWLSKQCLK